MLFCGLPASQWVLLFPFQEAGCQGRGAGLTDHSEGRNRLGLSHPAFVPGVDMGRLPPPPFALPPHLIYGEVSHTVTLLSRDNRFTVHLTPYANKLHKTYLEEHLLQSFCLHPHAFLPLSSGVGLSEFQRHKGVLSLFWIISQSSSSGYKTPTILLTEPEGQAWTGLQLGGTLAVHACRLLGNPKSHRE